MRGPAILTVLILLSFLAWLGYKVSIKHYDVASVSENCRKWASKKPITGTADEQAQAEQAEDEIYARCREDVFAYVAKHKMEKPVEFLATADERRSAITQQQAKEKFKKSLPSGWRQLVENAVKSHLAGIRLTCDRGSERFFWGEPQEHAPELCTVRVKAICTLLPPNENIYNWEQVFDVSFTTNGAISNISKISGFDTGGGRDRR